MKLRIIVATAEAETRDEEKNKGWFGL